MVVELFQKLYLQIYARQFMTSQIIPLPCPFLYGKCGKEGKNLQKFEYLENENNFFDEIKIIFHSFGRAITWWKNKNLIKNKTQALKSF